MYSTQSDEPIIECTISPDHLPSDTKKLWQHQEKALNDLRKHFVVSKKRAGFVVVPTGGGKTVIAAHWLLQNHVAKGGRVLWLTHRSHLLRQARATFNDFSYLLTGSAISKLKMGIVASAYMGWSKVGPDLQIVFSMLQSACTMDGIKHVTLMLQQSPKPRGLFVVVDEAHHACARTWIKLIRKLKERDCPILGLTATPMRMNEDDGRRLHKLFDKTVITQVKKSELMHKGILAKPAIETIDTEVNIEGDFVRTGKPLITKYGDLAHYVLDKLVRNSARNKFIVAQYKKNRAKYGKTIVFAIDIIHATTLTKEFQKAGITAKKVVSSKPNEGAVEAFKNQTEPEVLVNVMMLTEGFDAPCTKTVFITRPTNSDALVQQMVGRALRGPDAGGHEQAHLVTFVDTWSQFTPFDPQIEMLDGETNEQEPTIKGRIDSDPISQEIILEAYAVLRKQLVGGIVASYAHLPESWYSWTNDGDEGPSQRHILVFAHQQDAFEALRKHVAAHPKKFTNRNLLSPSKVDAIIGQFFHDCPDPVPTESDVRDLISAWRIIPEDVTNYTLEEKKKFSPQSLAKILYEMPVRDHIPYLQKLMEENALCKFAYHGDTMLLKEDVDRAINRITRPAPPPSKNLALPPPPDKPLALWPSRRAGYDLNRLAERVLKVNFSKCAPKVSEISWSDTELKCYWAYYSPTKNNIIVNRILNSPDIKEFVLEFILYHELLHADMPNVKHGGDFRPRERAFEPSDVARREAPDGTEPGDWKTLCDQWLGTLNRRYKIDTDDGCF